MNEERRLTRLANATQERGIYAAFWLGILQRKVFALPSAIKMNLCWICVKRSGQKVAVTQVTTVIVLDESSHQFSDASSIYYSFSKRLAVDSV